MSPAGPSPEGSTGRRPRPEGPTGRRPRPVRPSLDEERRLWGAGHRWVAGLDEVGRGAWAGPVSVGVAVVEPGARPSSMPAWLRDSKQLTERRREAVFEEVARWCPDGAVGHATAAECDRWGMTAAVRLAARRALALLEVLPSALLVDGPFDLVRAAGHPTGQPVDQPVDSGPDLLGATVVPLVGADARCASVAAASVLAKVVRDRLMRQEAEHFPFYGFDRNKGYPSSTHRTALQGYGLSAIHRRSWSFVGDLPWR